LRLFLQSNISLGYRTSAYSIRRRERVIRIFPNRESLVRLIGALLIEFDEKWASGRRYLDMTEYETWLNDRPKDIKKVTLIG
jgi:putative transposase